jgi:hypothetical protein
MFAGIYKWTSFSLLAVSAAVWIFVGQGASAQSFNLDKKRKTTSTTTTLHYANTSHLPKLDVIIPVFNPNIPRKDKDDVWPEVRRAEANRFALMMKKALERSGAFGAVRVTPDDSGFGELYVHGKILKANGEDIELQITVNDIRGKKKLLLKKVKFKHRVQESFHKSVRTKGTDAYRPIFDKIAQTIVKKLARKKAKEMNSLPALTQMRFANMFGSDYFGKYIKASRGKYKLVGFPSENDPVYARIRTMRIQEQLFVDSLQAHYEAFSIKMNPHYFAWQESALPIAKERRKAKAAATWKTVFAVAAVAAGAASGDDTLATVGGAIGAGLIYSSIGDYRAKSESSRVLDEMGHTLNLDLGTQVIEFEGVQKQLEGDAVDQFIGYRRYLIAIYEREATPDVVISR